MSQENTNNTQSRGEDNNSSTPTISKSTESKNYSYTDNRTVIIHRKVKPSQFAKENRLSLGEGNHKVGSTVSSVTTMLQSLEELDVYMPMIKPISRNEDKVSHYKYYFDSISIRIPSSGLKLNTSFIYDKESDFKRIEAEETKILEEYSRSSKVNPVEARKVKERKIIELESTKYKYGRPINPSDYIAWRFCLISSEVANEEQFANNSDKIRFFMTSEKELKSNKLKTIAINRAVEKAFDKCCEDSNLAKNVGYSFSFNKTIVDDMDELILKLYDKKENAPEEFIEKVNDKNLNKIAFIQRCVDTSLLRKIPNSSIITDEDGNEIGRDLESTLINFYSDKYKVLRNNCEARLKTL